MPLHLLFEGSIVESLPLDARMALGRSPSNDWVLRDRSISSHHALLFREAHQVLLKDLGSRNGTWVRLEGEKDWRRLVKAEPLVHRTEIRLGHQRVLRWDADERVAAGLGPLVLRCEPSGLVVGVHRDHLPLPGLEGAMLVMHGDGGVSLCVDDQEAKAVLVGQRFEVDGRHFVLEADEDPTPATLNPAVSAFPYQLVVDLSAGSAVLRALDSERRSEFSAEARVALLYALGKRSLDSEGDQLGGWLDDHDASVAVWGRGYLEHGRNNLNVLIHRIRAKLERGGLERWCIEKRPGQSRLRVDQVSLR